MRVTIENVNQIMTALELDKIIHHEEALQIV
jgi:hypothetical protein